MNDFRQLGLSPSDVAILTAMASDLDGVALDIKPPDIRSAVLVSEGSKLADDL